MCIRDSQQSGYYAPSARYGTPDDFRYLIDKLHQAGIGVIMDWVPGHFPKDQFALAEFDGTKLYEHPDPMRGEQPDWGTLIFNYGRCLLYTSIRATCPELLYGNFRENFSGLTGKGK